RDAKGIGAKGSMTLRAAKIEEHRQADDRACGAKRAERQASEYAPRMTPNMILASGWLMIRVC
ncbi:MAG: hypothetical protein ACREFB_12250, partial [Stellaceae bacterium]